MSGDFGIVLVSFFIIDLLYFILLSIFFKVKYEIVSGFKIIVFFLFKFIIVDLSLKEYLFLFIMIFILFIRFFIICLVFVGFGFLEMFVDGAVIGMLESCISLSVILFVGILILIVERFVVIFFGIIFFLGRIIVSGFG